MTTTPYISILNYHNTKGQENPKSETDVIYDCGLFSFTYPSTFKTIPIQKESSIEFKISRSKLLDAIDSSKYEDESLNNCIIILDNLQQASSNVLESLIPVFDETKKTIFLPNGDTINKGKYNLIAIFDPTYKGNNIKNALPISIKYSSLLYKR